MKLLALSTSGRAASAALIEGDQVLARAFSDDGLTHSETILPLVDSLFGENAPFSFDELDAFAADIGPGSFTGVRIGVSIANALAAATGKPVIGVSSLEALARAASQAEPVCALIDARHSNCYAAVYDGQNALLPPAALTLEEALENAGESTLFTGDGAAAYEAQIRAAYQGARFAPERLFVLTADMLARPALEALLRGEGKREIFPLYLRPSQAERLFKEKP